MRFHILKDALCLRLLLRLALMGGKANGYEETSGSLDRNIFTTGCNIDKNLTVNTTEGFKKVSFPSQVGRNFNGSPDHSSIKGTNSGIGSTYSACESSVELKSAREGRFDAMTTCVVGSCQEVQKTSVDTIGITEGANNSNNYTSIGVELIPVIIRNSQFSAVTELPSHIPNVIGDESDSDEHNKTEFLPFAEWKKIKLNEKQHQARSEPQARMKEMLDYSKGDSLGDDMELDLGIFTSTEDDEPDGKLYQEKFNYASLDCAASIVKTNSEAQGASSILYENKDKYLLNPCTAANKFVVIELCEDILIENIAIANYEFFSSTFKRLRFSASDRFPVPKNGWKVLGEFDAENSRDLQQFKIPSPMIWARYLRVEILSHYGHEFYCPISVVRAHGKTMMDEFKMTQDSDNGQHVVVDELERESVSNSPIPADNNEHCDAKRYTGVEFYSNPLIFSSNNMSVELFWDGLASQCRAALPPLMFEEFIKGMNDSPNTGKQTKVLDFSATIPPSFTEESIFKNIMKRISSLETNATLSVLYIEEQSRLLSKSFSSLEKTHAKKFDTLVAAFNDTIMANLDTLNLFARQLREYSFKLLEDQRLENDQFTTLTLRRLDDMEKDAKFQKKMMYLILFAFSALLTYILLTREAYIDERMEDDGWYLDSPPLQKAKDRILRKAARAVSSPTILKSFNVNEMEHPKLGRVCSFSSSSSASEDYDYRDKDEEDNNARVSNSDSALIGRARTYSKLLAAYENEVDIDEIMSNSSDNSATSTGMDGGLDFELTELSSRESSQKDIQSLAL